jgi:hypothetical protein
METAFSAELSEKCAKRVFQETLDLIHIALVNHYGLTPAEASELETDLFLWFQRFCQRPGAKPAFENRHYLLVASCEAARDYQRYAIAYEERSLNKKVEDVLRREPEEVAQGFARGVDLIKHRFRHD